MKNIQNYISVLFITCLLITFSSCDKITRDLGKATSSGENTMGFYVDGQAVKIKGEFQRGGLTSGPYGVDCGIINGKFIDVYGVSKDPRFYLNITVPVDSLNRDGEYRLQRAWNGKDEAAISDDSNFGGNHYNTTEEHDGMIKFSRYDDNVISGSFHFDAINKENGKVISVTEGRFDIKR